MRNAKRKAQKVPLCVPSSCLANVPAPQELPDAHLVPEVLPALRELAEQFVDVAWEAPALAALINELLARHNLKVPKLAMPLRVMLVG